jgi:hypothetical protein
MAKWRRQAPALAIVGSYVFSNWAAPYALAVSIVPLEKFCTRQT